VKLLFGDAVDAIENLLIYSTKPATLETNENESLRAGEINNSKMPLKEAWDSPVTTTLTKSKASPKKVALPRCLLVGIAMSA
jgi:hypothetical protein